MRRPAELHKLTALLRLFLPEERLLVTKLTPEQCCERLRTRTTSGSGFPSTAQLPPQFLFRGAVKPTGFRFVRNFRYRNLRLILLLFLSLPGHLAKEETRFLMQLLQETLEAEERPLPDARR